MLPTVNVRCKVYDQNGKPVAGSNISAKLSALEVSGGYIVPDRVSGITDDQGELVLALWPNALGAVASHYTVQISNPETGKTETLKATIPNNDCDLHLVANLPAYEGKTVGQLLLEEATAIILPAVASIETNVQIAVDKAQVATTEASEGAASAAAALVSQEVSQAAQITASNAAASAVTSAELATTKASIAVASEGVATTKAAEAATSAAEADSDATTATTKAGEALDAAAAALASEGAAGASATTATNAATTATTQAGIATTKAGEASDSATSAAASAAAAAASDPSAHVSNTNNPHNTTKAQVGLSNVDNTSDADKPVSTAQATALASKIDASQKDASGGFPGLTAFKLNLKNTAGNVLSWFTTAATAARTWTLPDKSGTIALLTDITGTNSNTNTGDETNASLLSKLGITVLSGSNTGDQVLPTLASLGLSNVTNTSDANKPVSTAQATALALKADVASPTFTGTVSGITKAMVGLANVDNTTDALKPVSTAQAAALALKQDADVNTAKLNMAQVRTAVETMAPTARASAAHTWAVNTDPNLTLTTTGNLTMDAPTGLVVGSFYFLEIVYGGTHTITWNGNFKGVTGISISSSIGARDAFMFRAQTTSILELVGSRLNVGA